MDYTAVLHVKESALLRFHRSRPVPFATKESIGREIDILLNI